MAMQDWRAPWWIAGSGPLAGNVQTIWPARASRYWPDNGVALTGRIERWITPDQDFIDVDWLVEPISDEAPLLVLFHGLEGSSGSHYAQAFAHWAWHRGWGCAVPHFRSCSGELNWAPRSYHSGDFIEADWVLRRFAQAHPLGPRVAVGISLGGNVLLRWAQEAGSTAAQWVQAVAAISAPLDLTAAGQTLGRGFNRLLYTRMFLNSMKPKALARLALHPGLYDEQALRAVRDIYEFDQVVTAPMHGFASTEDYWTRCSSGPHLREITGVPALVLNARNDPFMPASVLPRPDQVGPWVTLWQPDQGGHVGFPGGGWPGHVGQMPEAVGDWLAQHIQETPTHG
jgi:predicted alpha/beta-fold hydrolase